jgi:hypothetical protein
MRLHEYYKKECSDPVCFLRNIISVLDQNIQNNAINITYDAYEFFLLKINLNEMNAT